MEKELLKHYRVCNLCEAMCGLEITHDRYKVIAIKGDVRDPFSKGNICPKGASIHELHEDPDRLKKPLRKTKDGEWEEISWQNALDEIGNRINTIRKEHGDDAVGIYLGNPTVHNFGMMLFIGELKRVLGTKNNYSPTSMDQLPHHFMAYYMFGHPLNIPIPDIDHTDYMVIFGANPIASNGSIMSAAGVQMRLRNIQKRGGKVILIDPRRTETAKIADQHHFIRPGTDVYLLLGMLHLIQKNDWVQPGKLSAHLEGLDALQSLTATINLDTVAQLTGISVPIITELTTAYVKAKRAVLYGRMGLSTQEHGGLCHWLLQLINIMTGHFDTPGGAMFPKPAVTVKKTKGFRKKHGRWKSRVSKAPEFDGEFPVSVLAEEILESGDKQIRALITHAGNPVLSSPNAGALDKALPTLEFMVSIDIFLNETTRHADIILPPPSHLEVDHYDLIFNIFAVSNTAKFSPALFKPEQNQLYDWQIAKELIKRFEKVSSKKPSNIHKFLAPRQLLNLALLTGPYGKFNGIKNILSGLSLRKLQKSVHGISLGDLQPRIPEVLNTQNSKINLADPIFLDPAKQLITGIRPHEPESDKNILLLIGRRHLRSNNSWMHNAPSLMTGKNRCTAQIHPADAERLAIADKDLVTVSSKRGAITLPAEITAKVMPGVVSVPHGFGHHGKGTRLTVASTEANNGVNVNTITDHKRTDAITGNAAFSGQSVHVAKVK